MEKSFLWKYPITPAKDPTAFGCGVSEDAGMGQEKWIPLKFSGVCCGSKGRASLNITMVRGNGCPWDASTCNAAARGGHLLVLQWAAENNCPWDYVSIWSAAAGGRNFSVPQPKVLQWARENGCPWNSDSCLEEALKGNHV